MKVQEEDIPEGSDSQLPENADPVHDHTIDNSNKSDNKDDLDSDMDRYNQAVKASEASYTLEPEKGITPDPDSLNRDSEKDDNNVKK